MMRKIHAVNIRNFDLTISRDELLPLAPALVDTLREFVGYGLCRQNNAVERRMLSEKFAQLAHDAMRQFPALKLNHAAAVTYLTEDASTAEDNQ